MNMRQEYDFDYSTQPDWVPSLLLQNNTSTQIEVNELEPNA